MPNLPTRLPSHTPPFHPTPPHVTPHTHTILQKLKSLRNHCLELDFHKPTEDQVRREGGRGQLAWRLCLWQGGGG